MPLIPACPPPPAPVFPRTLAAVLLVVLPLGGCRGGDGARAPRTDPSGMDLSRGEEVITGNATFDERLRLPPRSVLVVQLLPRDGGEHAAGDDGAVLSNVRLVNVQGPSIPFALPYDPTEVGDGDGYALRARLSSPGGGLLFATESPVAVEPGSTDPIAFDMAYVGVKTTHWQCGPLSVDAGFDPLARTVTLAFSGHSLQLPLAISASGARYADEAGNGFWTRGDSGTLKLEGDAQPECIRVDEPSPWIEAAERGVAFRAVGNEPGWWVEVDRGEAPALRAVLDYGGREVEVAHAQPAGLGFTGATDEGIEVRLEITREPCQDVMSGERFEATATLAVGDDTYRGCGAFLPRR